MLKKMVFENQRSSKCHCPDTDRNIIRNKVSSVLIFLFLSTHVQCDYTATLQEDEQYARLKEIYPDLESIRKSPRYFWEQSFLNNPERVRIYDETVEPINQGMIRERDSKERNIQNATNDINPDTEDIPEPQYTDQGSFTATHETEYDGDTPGFHAGEGRPCSGGKLCTQREESQALMVEALKRNILMQLKMSEPPSITVPSISLDSPPVRRLMEKHGMKQHRHFSELENEYAEEEYQVEETTRETVISNARDPILPGVTGSYFTFSEQELQYTVSKADIWFYMKANPTNRTNLTIEFYRYQRNVTHPDATPVEVKFNTQKIHAHKRSHWKEFTITHEVSRWFLHPETNLGIDIRCREVPGLIISGPTPEHEDKKPMVEVRLRHNVNSTRRKRDIDLRCDANSEETRCCRYKFTISFASMGWNWIISPRVYTSYYCSGECPLFFLQSNQKRMLSMGPESIATSVAKSCCAPIKMDKMSMLYFDNDENIIYSDVPDMIVKKCGCM